MKRLMMLGAMVAVFGLGSAAAFAATSDVAASVAGNEQVCPEGDSGKIDVSGSHTSITVTAPEGKLISGYCVKAGSANQELGPEPYTVSPPAKTVTITHSSGKDISHYSVTFVAEETPPAETPPAETPPAETPPAETPPAETPPAETPPAETPPAQTPPAETTPAETTPAGTTPADTTPTQSLPTETTGTTPAEAPSTEAEESHVFAPPTSQKPKPAATRPAPVESVNAAATRPNKAAQAAPFTP